MWGVLLFYWIATWAGLALFKALEDKSWGAFNSQTREYHRCHFIYSWFYHRWGRPSESERDTGMPMLGSNLWLGYKHRRKGKVCSHIRTIQNDGVPAEGKAVPMWLPRIFLGSVYLTACLSWPYLDDCRDQGENQWAMTERGRGLSTLDFVLQMVEIWPSLIVRNFWLSPDISACGLISRYVLSSGRFLPRRDVVVCQGQKKSKKKRIWKNNPKSTPQFKLTQDH
jgi:hypothetical protein